MIAPAVQNRFRQVPIALIATALALSAAQLAARQEVDDSTFTVDLNANRAEREFVGRVVDTDGEPVSGALIEWGPWDAEFSARIHTRADTGGRYRLVVREVGPQYRLAASAEGLAPSHRERLIPGRLGSPTRFDFELSVGHRLSGVVVDADGEPIRGVDVTVHIPERGFHSSFSYPTPASPLPGESRQATTDDQGAFRFDSLPDVALGVRISDANLRIVRREVIEGDNAAIVNLPTFTSDHEYRITCARRAGAEEELDALVPGVIRLRVIDAATRETIQGVRLTRRLKTSSWTPVLEDGVYLHSDEITAGSQYMLNVFAPGYAPQTIRPYAGTVEMDTFSEVVQLVAGRDVSGELIDASNGLPVRAANLVFSVAGSTDYLQWYHFDRYDDSMDGMTFCQRATSDMAGRFSFREGDEPGTLLIMADGYQRRIVTVDQIEEARRRAEDGETIRIELHPESTLHVTASIHGDWTPIRSAAISREEDSPFWETFESFEPMDDGSWRIGGLAPGVYSVSVTPDSTERRLPGTTARMEFGAGEHRELVIGDGWGPRTLSGRATPFSSIVVEPMFEWEYTAFETTADADGKYLVLGLEDGEYSITWRRPQQVGFIDTSSESHTVTVAGDTVYHLP